MKKYKSVNKKLSMLVATVLLTSHSVLASAVETPVTTTTTTSIETPVETPVTTPVETPVETPVTTPVKTPVETPVTTPVTTTTPVETSVTTPVTTTTPVETPVTTPVETPVTATTTTTPVETPVTTTPVETPVTTPVETPVETHEVGILDAEGNSIKDWSAVAIRKSSGDKSEKEVGTFYVDDLAEEIANLEDGAYTAHLEKGCSFITFNNDQVSFSIKNGTLSNDIKFISNEVTGLIDFSNLLETSSYFYVTNSRGDSLKMYATTNFAIQSLSVGTYTVTKMKNLAETEGDTHTITITPGVVKVVGLDDDKTPVITPSETPSETPSNVPSETPSNVPSETPSNVLSETPSNASSETLSNVPLETPSNVLSETPSETPSETLNPHNKVSAKSNSVKTGDTSSAIYLMAAVSSLLCMKRYKPRHARK